MKEYTAWLELPMAKMLLEAFYTTAERRTGSIYIELDFLYRRRVYFKLEFFACLFNSDVYINRGMLGFEKK